MDLLTVTCDRDFEEIIQQAKSIKKYLAPCKHWIFVNNTTKTKEFWITGLTPYYDIHELEIIFTDDHEIFPIANDWITQQIWKCRAIDWIKKDYVIVDSKTFFIRPTDIRQWTHEGSGVITFFTKHDFPVDDLYYQRNRQKNLMLQYCKLINVDPIEEYYTCVTPFLVRANVMQQVSKFLKKNNIFLSNLVDGNVHYEFILYSIFAKHSNLNFNKIPQLWSLNGRCLYFHDYKHQGNFDSVRNKLEICDTFIATGFHDCWIKDASTEDRIKMLDWLVTLDIETDGMKQKYSIDRTVS